MLTNGSQWPGVGPFFGIGFRREVEPGEFAEERASELTIDDCHAVLAMTCLRLMMVAVIWEKWRLQEAKRPCLGGMGVASVQACLTMMAA
jgi:hypothetical protein